MRCEYFKEENAGFGPSDVIESCYAVPGIKLPTDLEKVTYCLAEGHRLCPLYRKAKSESEETR